MIMRRKRAICAMLLTIAMCLSGCLFEEKPTEIKKGFSPQLLDCLQTQYGITIPEEAEFLKGYNLPGFQDPFVAILFECPIKENAESDYAMSQYLKQLLKLDDRYSFAGADIEQFFGSEWYAELCGKMQWMLQGYGYTYISYNIEPDKLVIRFTGWRPRKTFS